MIEYFALLETLMASPPPNPDESPGSSSVRDFWYGLINYEQKSPIAADLKLERIRKLLDRLGNPEKRLRIIHVAGTKGKGSTSAMLAGILQKAGYRTGLFTSPHLFQVEERFQVDGEPITPKELDQLLNEVREVTLKFQDPLPTFFEVTTAIGFLHFVRRRADLAVIETGLGGRLDSTNVCLPLLSIITTISLDHVQILGDRIDQIAWEKAGIVKNNRPTLSGAVDPEARKVIEKVCRERSSPLKQLGIDFSFEFVPGKISSQINQPSILKPETASDWPPMKLGLIGEHQAGNATLVVAAIEELRKQGFTIPDRAVEKGLAEVYWPGRLEILSRSPMVVIDCSHNVASIQAVVNTIHASFITQKRILVFAASSDKDIEGMLKIVVGQFDHLCLTRYTEGRRSASPETLAEMILSFKSSPVSYSIHQDPKEALKAAQEKATREDMICITGSIFLAGELRHHLKNILPPSNPFFHNG